MSIEGDKNPNANLENLGIKNTKTQYWNITREELIEETIKRGQGVLNDTGALAVDTGEFTGRSPKDKFIVRDNITKDSVDWNSSFNQAIEPSVFDSLYTKITAHLAGKDVFVRDCIACAHESYKLNVRVVTENPWSSLFASNMFLRPTSEEIKTFNHDWLIIQAPSFVAEGAVDGIRQHNFTILDFTRKIIIIGGSAVIQRLRA